VTLLPQYTLETCGSSSSRVGVVTLASAERKPSSPGSARFPPVSAEEYICIDDVSVRGFV
jgi:hypothetical protein